MKRPPLTPFTAGIGGSACARSTTKNEKSRAPSLPAQPESQIVKHILDDLTLRFKGKAAFWRNNTGASKTEWGGFIKFGVVGSADIFGVLGPSGRFVALEVKTPTGRMRPEQKLWLAEMSSLGAMALVVRSVEEAVQAVEKAIAEQGAP